MLLYIETSSRSDNGDNTANDKKAANSRTGYTQV